MASDVAAYLPPRQSPQGGTAPAWPPMLDFPQLGYPNGTGSYPSFMPPGIKQEPAWAHEDDRGYTSAFSVHLSTSPRGTSLGGYGAFPAGSPSHGCSAAVSSQPAQLFSSPTYISRQMDTPSCSQGAFIAGTVPPCTGLNKPAACRDLRPGLARAAGGRVVPGRVALAPLLYGRTSSFSPLISEKTIAIVKKTRVDNRRDVWEHLRRSVRHSASIFKVTPLTPPNQDQTRVQPPRPGNNPTPASVGGRSVRSLTSFPVS
ncbi:Hypp2116 [Branchiostoma lanceolatum]|uniref:Hypp2116 protein n=1 Tax=Branchiostoma lanceolatum TaxID=7740 RepID=A0A8J9ZRG5_BRALA|nr:Hypp2116 [Branchiostoma lanceolatum]